MTDIKSFVRGLISTSKPRYLGTVQSIQLCHRDLSVPISYAGLLSEQPDWQHAGTKRKPRDREDTMAYSSIAKEADDVLYAWKLLNQAEAQAQAKGTKGGSVVMPKLRRVTMAPNQERLWNHVFDASRLDHRKLSRPLPLQLLSQPSVEHYCQSMLLGPLALPNGIIKLDNPPKVFTYHSKSTGPEAAEALRPPIVLGAINRHIYHGVYFVCVSVTPTRR